MSTLDTYKKIIIGFDDPNPELLKFVLKGKTKNQYLRELKENMNEDILEWQRWFSILDGMIEND